MCGGEKIIINCLMHSSLAQHHPLISNHHHHRVKISPFLACSKRNDGESVKPFFPLWWQESISKRTSYLKWIPTHTKTFLLSFFAVKIIQREELDDDNMCEEEMQEWERERERVSLEYKQIFRIKQWNLFFAWIAYENDDDDDDGGKKKRE